MAGYTRPVRIRVAATILCTCWWIAEYIRSSFRDKGTTSNLDKGSSKLWDLGHFIGVIGIITGFTRAGRLQDGEEWISVCGFMLMLMGISIRWLAIHTLGHHFTGRVSVVEGQHVVKTGLYRHLRHPAYAGALLGNLGMGLAFANWISFILIFVPILLAAFYRMHVEEEVLRNAFGEEYDDYSSKTKRLIPWIH